MDIQIGVANSLIVLAGGVFGWLIRTLWTATEDLKNDLAKLKEDLPVKFLLKDDYKDDIREIKEMLKAITHDLKNKEDKIIR